jgi:predicted DNA-binding transcriptional regulator YafY
MAATFIVDGDHLGRLMRLCRSLAQGNGVSLPQLQTRLKTSRRTVFRDFLDLAACGIQVEHGPAGYRVKPTAAQCRRILAESQLKAVEKVLADCLK